MTQNPKLYKNAIVEKRNVLNEIRKNSMSLQELRFFSIYLSKINPYDVSTRLVRFPIEEFQRIMGFQSLNIVQIRNSFTKLLQQVVSVPNENRPGFSSFQLFKECTLERNDLGEWYVTIDAHDRALPLMFDFKSRYFKYELWNALRLKSTNQIRMYEVLKQYEKLGKRELTITELRDLLGITPDEYSGRTGWSDFKKYVLDSCQQALQENTDICYTYEKGKSGRGGKWLTVVFHIEKNPNHVDQLSLSEFIEQQSEPEISEDKQPALLETNCEFTAEQMQTLVEKADWVSERQRSDYLRRKYRDMDMQDRRLQQQGKQIIDRFAYLCKMIENDYKNYLTDAKNKSESESAAYDLEAYENSSIFDE